MICFESPTNSLNKDFVNVNISASILFDMLRNDDGWSFGDPGDRLVSRRAWSLETLEFPVPLKPWRLIFVWFCVCLDG